MDRPALICFHCGDSVPLSCNLTVSINGENLPVCCSGCEAVASFILRSGQARYYDFRTANALRPNPEDADVEANWLRFDERQSLWGSQLQNGQYEMLLQVEGIHCAACAWLIRSQLESRPGVGQVQVDVATGFVRITWQPDRIRLSKIAGILAGVGYRPHLPLAAAEETGRQLERRTALKRLAVAGLGMMQVMMYAVALYTGEAMGISEANARFLQWVSLLVTTPVLLYSGRPFYSNAWRSLRHAKVSMDVPVALAITIAFSMSCFNFLTGKGHVYFDSVVMFVFFLSLGRYAELMIRHRNLQTGLALARLLPEWAERLSGDQSEQVPSGDLRVNDKVRVKAGQTFPADGVILEGSTQANEALLTGESRPLAKQPGAKVVAGSINLAQSVIVKVTADPDNSTVSLMGRMLMKSQTRRSRFARLSERMAGWFVGVVLLLAMATASYWFFHDKDMLIPATLAVLVISCPCALSLATPAAIASASRALLQKGVLLTRGMALEVLNHVDTVVFDKTGTLTSGTPVIVDSVINPQLAGLMTADEALQIAALLERDSSHPLAKAFSNVACQSDRLTDASSHKNGVTGTVDGRRYRLGNARFSDAPDMHSGTTLGRLWLANEDGWVARFELDDSLRPGVSDALQYLRNKGLKLVILSGDHPYPVASIAEQTGINEYLAEQTPQMKMDYLQSLQGQGHRVLMVGDGVNDAPVLASANVSMTVSGASELANSQADFILTGRSLKSITDVFDCSTDTHRTIKQNLAWSLTYNITAIPFAAAGMIAPWVAALGMSLSSLLVVLNSARLAGRHRANNRKHIQPAAQT